MASIFRCAVSSPAFTSGFDPPNALPAAAPAFPAPSRAWTGFPASPPKTVIVGVADMIASNDPAAELVTYSLGSCLGVTIYDPLTKAGGLLHLMLPDSSIDPVKGRSSPHMFVDTGVPRLFHTVYSLGGEKRRLVVKVAGGALFLDAARRFNIGERNLEALEATLANAGHAILARDTGGTSSRTLRIELASGAVSVQTPGRPAYRL